MSVWSPAFDSNVDSPVVAYWNLFTNTQVQHANQHSVNHRIYHHWHRHRLSKDCLSEVRHQPRFQNLVTQREGSWFWKVLLGRNVSKIPSFDHSWGGKGMYPSWKKAIPNIHWEFHWAQWKKKKNKIVDKVWKNIDYNTTRNYIVLHQSLMKFHFS